MAKQKFELSSTYIIEVSFDGGGAAIAVGSRTVRTVPFDCEVTGWTGVVIDPWGINVSVLVSVKTYTYKSYPAAVKMGINTKHLWVVNDSKGQGLVSWPNVLKKYDQLVFSVDYSPVARHIVIALHVKSK